jgi:tRNA dimethylallyltransferase
VRRQKILVIVGPTASGKSALAVRIAKRFRGEVISADSRQVYRMLNIGTGKITRAEQRGVPHHLLDVASPKRTFTAQDFSRMASRVVSDITRRDRLPIVAGGTGFYIDALVGRSVLPDVPQNLTLRKKLSSKNATQLFAMLKKKDPRRARTIDPHNPRRLIRALEITDALGKNPPLRHEKRYDVLWIGIAPTPQQLERRIVTRLRERMKRGMVAEARKLRAAGVSLKRMKELGLEYRALAKFLKGSVSRKDMEAELVREIRRYAKRQITYWKRNADILWFNPEEARAIERKIAAWLR